MYFLDYKQELKNAREGTSGFCSNWGPWLRGAQHDPWHPGWLNLTTFLPHWCLTLSFLLTFMVLQCHAWNLAVACQRIILIYCFCNCVLSKCAMVHSGPACQEAARVGCSMEKRELEAKHGDKAKAKAIVTPARAQSHRAEWGDSPDHQASP